MSERLNESEREASYCTRAGCYARHVHTPAVEAILASRLAAVKALADEWERDPGRAWVQNLAAELRAALAPADHGTDRADEEGDE